MKTGRVICQMIFAEWITFLWSLPLLLLAAPAFAGEDEVFNGEWQTSFGTVKVKQKHDDATGTYGPVGQFTLKGTIEGRKLSFEFQQGNSSGEAHWTIDDAGNSFHGDFQLRGGQNGEWIGLRPDPKANTSQVRGMVEVPREELDGAP